LNDLGYRYAGEYSRYLIAHAEPGAICRGKKQD
jgi:hypothetical protein